MTLTPRAEAAMRFIQESIVKTGRSPIYVEIGERIGVSSKGRIHAIVGELEAKGYVSRANYTARGLQVLKPLPDRFEEAAKAVCEALGHTSPEDVMTARKVMVSTLIDRSAA